jgi:hypothetical protein
VDVDEDEGEERAGEIDGDAAASGDDLLLDERRAVNDAVVDRGDDAPGPGRASVVVNIAKGAEVLVGVREAGEITSGTASLLSEDDKAPVEQSAVELSLHVNPCGN